MSAPQKHIDQPLEVAERYCVVVRTLAKPPALSTDLARTANHEGPTA